MMPAHLCLAPFAEENDGRAAENFSRRTAAFAPLAVHPFDAVVDFVPCAEAFEVPELEHRSTSGLVRLCRGKLPWRGASSWLVHRSYAREH